ncbi:unnamed protein product [Coccothraustes coccothraustes]
METEGASAALGLNGRGGGGSAAGREQAAFVPLGAVTCSESLSCACLPSARIQIHVLAWSASDPFVSYSVSDPFVTWSVSDPLLLPCRFLRILRVYSHSVSFGK